MFSRILFSALLAVLVLLTVASSGLAAPEPKPGVAPAKSSPYGMTYSQWGAAFWKWSLGMPANDTHPGLDPGSVTNCGEQSQSGPVWFLAGTYATFTDLESGDVIGNAERSCTIPAGKALFVTPMTVECSTVEGNGASENDLAACADGYMAQAHDLFVAVDGISIDDLTRYRFVSAFDTFTLPQPNILGMAEPQPNPSPFVADGFYTMVLPLGEGEHEVRFAGHLGTGPGEFRTDVLYRVTVK